MIAFRYIVFSGLIELNISEKKKKFQKAPSFVHTGGSYRTICALWSEAGKFALWCLGDLFSDLMPVVLVREGGELQHDRARQGLVPDLKLLLNIPGGQDNCLALD